MSRAGARLKRNVSRRSALVDSGLAKDKNASPKGGVELGGKRNLPGLGSDQPRERDEKIVKEGGEQSANEESSEAAGIGVAYA